MARETKAQRHERMREQYIRLIELYPVAQCSLHHRNEWELLVATVMSAQTTDERVNSVTPELFDRYPDAQALAQAQLWDVENIIRPVGFYRMKALHIIELSQALVERFDGVVPHTMDELTTLPGVGRKTANVVLGDAFHLPGFPVDTHVKRVTSRLRWHTQWRKTNPDPVEIEKQVTAEFPPEWWADVSHRLIFFGRNICHARNPECEICPLRESCPAAPQFLAQKAEKEARKKYAAQRKALKGHQR